VEEIGQVKELNAEVTVTLTAREVLALVSWYWSGPVAPPDVASAIEKLQAASANQ
jgi:hypothetical protein